MTAQGPRRPLAATLALAAVALTVLATPAAAQPVDDLGADALWVWWWDDPAELADYVVDNGFDRVYLFTEGGFGALDPLGDHPDDHIVRDQVAAVHVLLGRLAELGPLRHGGPEDVAGRVVGQAEVLLQAFSLRSLSGPGGSEQDQIQLRHEPCRLPVYFRKPS